MQMAGEILAWEVYILDPTEYVGLQLDESWGYLDEKLNLTNIETLYIRQLAGI